MRRAISFVNVAAMRAADPAKYFSVPKFPNKIEVGEYAKIGCVLGDGLPAFFWVRVDSVGYAGFTGAVDDSSAGFEIGEVILDIPFSAIWEIGSHSRYI